MNDSEKLNDAFSNYEKEVNAHKSSVEEKEDRIATFLQDFEKVARSVIEPVFNEVLEDVKARGHSGSVRVKPYSKSDRKDDGSIQTVSITFEIFMKDIKKRHNNHEPRIFFNARSDHADARKVDVICDFSTSGELTTGGHITTSHISQKRDTEYQIDSITPEIAKTEAVNFLIELFKSLKVVK